MFLLSANMETIGKKRTKELPVIGNGKTEF